MYLDQWLRYEFKGPQHNLAAISGVSPATVSNICNGLRSVPLRAYP